MTEKGTGCGHPVIKGNDKCRHAECRAERKKIRDEKRKKRDRKESADKPAQERGETETESTAKRAKTDAFAGGTASLPPAVSPVANKVCCLCSVCSR